MIKPPPHSGRRSQCPGLGSVTESLWGEREMVAPGGGGDSLLGEGVLLRGEKGSRMIPSKLIAELWLLHEDVLRGPR